MRVPTYRHTRTPTQPTEAGDSKHQRIGSRKSCSTRRLTSLAPGVGVCVCVCVCVLHVVVGSLHRRMHTRTHAHPQDCHMISMGGGCFPEMYFARPPSMRKTPCVDTAASSDDDSGAWMVTFFAAGQVGFGFGSWDGYGCLTTARRICTMRKPDPEQAGNSPQYDQP